jgi:hypothetical protein
MIMKRQIIGVILLVGAIAVGLEGCQKGNLAANPNLASTSTTVPVPLILNRITYEMYEGGGVLDGVSGNYQESPWSQVQRFNQFYLSLYSYYWGTNNYNWSNSATMYSVLKYVELMESQAKTQYGAQANPYTALAKFFRAYLFIWYTQRVGDIPMSQAGNTSILTPVYDSQDSVYFHSLALLDTANTLMGTLATLNGTQTVSGDIYGMTIAQWQKVINTYKLRVLISLSRRAVDNPGMNIPTQFANIINNPTQYPIMAGNSDNLEFHYNSTTNKYPIFPNYQPYDFFEAVCATYLNITTGTQDPRTFISATPAPAQLTAGKQVSDFTAYVGANMNYGQSQLLDTSELGNYSFANNLRYFTDATGATQEPYVILGYPELCFNIAEAAYLGWIPSASAGTWYLDGINASLAMYGLKDGTVIPIGDNKGNPLGSVTANVTQFLTNVAYVGNTPAGLNQILTQKYVAFWQNSGFEPYYNWRRTGVPAFEQGGSGIGTSTNQIPIRWQYPLDEAQENTTNWQTAITNQFSGTDNIFATMWLTK